MELEILIQQAHNKLTCIHHLGTEEIETLQRTISSLQTDLKELNMEEV